MSCSSRTRPSSSRHRCSSITISCPWACRPTRTASTWMRSRDFCTNRAPSSRASCTSSRTTTTPQPPRLPLSAEPGSSSSRTRTAFSSSPMRCISFWTGARGARPREWLRTTSPTRKQKRRLGPLRGWGTLTVKTMRMTTKKKRHRRGRRSSQGEARASSPSAVSPKSWHRALGSDGSRPIPEYSNIWWSAGLSSSAVASLR
mmetsp:Transcript_20947/g.67775  ORF Transcript_20947/g.67775 Transcript_20947/m.67775 type:complete len:202 (-) Transcript_20947:175-780(-)